MTLAWRVKCVMTLGIQGIIVLKLKRMWTTSITTIVPIESRMEPTEAKLPRLISLDPMLLPNMTETQVNLSSGNHLGGCKACMEFKQEFPAQLSSVIELCSLVLCVDIRIASLIPNLVTTFACYPPCIMLVVTTQLCHLKFHLGCVIGNGVISSNCQCCDKTESLLWVVDTRLCYSARAGIMGSSHNSL
jgi:hypothetical protein